MQRKQAPEQQIDPMASAIYKESIMFETIYGDEWLVVCDGETVKLYNMQNEKKHGDKRAEYCGQIYMNSEMYFEFLHNRQSTMLKFALQLLTEIPVTDADQISEAKATNTGIARPVSRGWSLRG